MRKIDKATYRVIDANYNRVKEGLRVCEDICRFYFGNKQLAREYKDARHAVVDVFRVYELASLLSSRDIRRDVGKKSNACELKRSDVLDILYANSQRVKESLRVLEEFSKLKNKRSASRIKVLRYRMYAVEKKLFFK